MSSYYDVNLVKIESNSNLISLQYCDILFNVNTGYFYCTEIDDHRVLYLVLKAMNCSNWIIMQFFSSCLLGICFKKC